MSLTKKDFEALARAFKQEAVDPSKVPAEFAGQRAVVKATVARLANAVANVCRTDNPRFNRDQFLHACGIAE